MTTPNPFTLEIVSEPNNFWPELTYQYVPYLLVCVLLLYILYLGYQLLRNPSVATGLRIIIAYGFILLFLSYPAIYDEAEEITPEDFVLEDIEYILMQANLTIHGLENLTCYSTCPQGIIIQNDSLTTTKNTHFGLFTHNQTTYVTQGRPHYIKYNLTRQ